MTGEFKVTGSKSICSEDENVFFGYTDINLPKPKEKKVNDIINTSKQKKLYRFSFDIKNSR